MKYLSSGLLASGSADFSIRFWNLISGAIVYNITSAHGANAVNYLAQLPNGYLASASVGASGNLLIWDLSTYTSVKTLTGHTSDVNVIKVLGNGDLISGSKDNTAKIW